MTLNPKIVELFCEESMLAPKDVGSGAGGGKQSWSINRENKPSAHRNKDKRRKRIERSRERRLNPKSITSNNTEEEIDPRENLEGELRLTLKETFVFKLMEYVANRKSHYIRDALNLMDEYPQLKKYVYEESRKRLPQKSFAVYSVRESSLNEEIGKAGYRSGNGPHNWYISKHEAVRNKGLMESYYIMEAKILPKHVMLYVPAFTNEMENLIHSGKIQEPKSNIIRSAKQMNEVILPKEIDTGLIVEVN